MKEMKTQDGRPRRAAVRQERPKQVAKKQRTPKGSTVKPSLARPKGVSPALRMKTKSDTPLKKQELRKDQPSDKKGNKRQQAPQTRGKPVVKRQGTVKGRASVQNDQVRSAKATYPIKRIKQRPGAKQSTPTKTNQPKQSQQSVRGPSKQRSTKGHPNRRIVSFGFRRTGKSRGTKKTGRFTVLKELVIALVLAGVLFLVAFWLTIRLPKIEGYSMTPTISDQDRLLVYKWGKLSRFKLVYFEEPTSGELSVRRIIGLPGEELYYENGSLFVNGSEIPERFLAASDAIESEDPLTEDFTLQETTEISRVPEDSYFVLGDNRSYATDSRYFGYVKKEQIIGVVNARIFPIHAMRQF